MYSLLNQQPRTPIFGFKYVLGTAGARSMVIVTTTSTTGHVTAYAQYQRKRRRMLLLLTDDVMYLLGTNFNNIINYLLP